MASLINDSCVKCMSCVSVCPVGAMHDADTQLVIDPDTCIDCGVCIAECPQSAITTEDEADEKWVKFNAEKAAECPAAEA